MRSIVIDILNKHNIPLKSKLILHYHQIGTEAYDVAHISSVFQLAVHFDTMYKFRKAMLEKATLLYKDKDYTIIIRDYIDTRLSQELFRQLSRQ